MKTVELSMGGHKWEKQNLTTVSKGERSYDLYKCKACGITGKSYQIGYITVCEKETKKMEKCKGYNCMSVKRRIKVLNCRAFGPQFENMVPGSVHDIIAPPDGKNNKRGEWVMGIGEPVLLLAGEYMYCD